jgi:hypothetical protein
MTAASKAWCLGILAAVNGLCVPSLTYTWLSIYRQYSYPIDFFLPIARTSTRASLILAVLAATVPVSLFVYYRSAQDLPSFIRIISLVITCCAACMGLSFAIWRYLR